jgi:carbon storage regulator
MLILSRKVGEKIYIGGGITITVIETQRGKTRFGVEAPKDVRVALTEEQLLEPPPTQQPARRKA